jgi:S-formylglutathione hydrolase FrmB
MQQHSNGKALSQTSARNMWHPDSEFWSANRAEHRLADGYELVAFDLPAANGYPAIIGWDLFGGPEYMTLVASGQAASFGEAKDACEAALVQALAALGLPPNA